MPRSCKCILDRMVFKGAMSEEDRDKIMRNLKMRWIPVTERFPEESGFYLCSIKSYDRDNYVLLGRFSMGKFNLIDVEAWMPLPKPYEEVNRMEVTRTIQIQITGVIDSKDIGENTPDIRPAEWVERDIKDMFSGYDQVLVEVKDFIREEGEEE